MIKSFIYVTFRQYERKESMILLFQVGHHDVPRPKELLLRRTQRKSSLCRIEPITSSSIWCRLLCSDDHERKLLTPAYHERGCITSLRRASFSSRIKHENTQILSGRLTLQRFHFCSMLHRTVQYLKCCTA